LHEEGHFRPSAFRAPANRSPAGNQQKNTSRKSAKVQKCKNKNLSETSVSQWLDHAAFFFFFCLILQHSIYPLGFTAPDTLEYQKAAAAQHIEANMILWTTHEFCALHPA
jgi:hypothetical protein